MKIQLFTYLLRIQQGNKESTTTAFRQEQERTEINETLSLTLQQFSNRLDTINSKVNAILSQKEKVVELSWWDLHKDKAYIIIALIIVVGVVYRRNK